MTEDKQYELREEIDMTIEEVLMGMGLEGAYCEVSLPVENEASGNLEYTITIYEEE